MGVGFLLLHRVETDDVGPVRGVRVGACNDLVGLAVGVLWKRSGLEGQVGWNVRGRGVVGVHVAKDAKLLHEEGHGRRNSCSLFHVDHLLRDQRRQRLVGGPELVLPLLLVDLGDDNLHLLTLAEVEIGHGVQASVIDDLADVDESGLVVAELDEAAEGSDGGDLTHDRLADLEGLLRPLLPWLSLPPLPLLGLGRGRVLRADEGELDPQAVQVDAQEPRLDLLALLDVVAHVLGELGGELGDVNEGVLAHANVDESAEGLELPHFSREHVPLLEVRDGFLHLLGVLLPPPVPPVSSLLLSDGGFGGGLLPLLLGHDRVLGVDYLGADGVRGRGPPRPAPPESAWPGHAGKLGPGARRAPGASFRHDAA